MSHWFIAVCSVTTASVMHGKVPKERPLYTSKEIFSDAVFYDKIQKPASHSSWQQTDLEILPLTEWLTSPPHKDLSYCGLLHKVVDGDRSVKLS